MSGWNAPFRWTLALLAVLTSPFVVHAATLQGTVAAPPGVVNLSAVGPADWSHWGFGNDPFTNRKAGVTPLIGALVAFNGTTPSPSTGMVTKYTWTGGTPTENQVGTKSGMRIFGKNKGLLFTVPADPLTRTLRVYVGAKAATGTLRATLSDGSAPEWSTVVSQPSGKTGKLVTLTYQAAGSGQSLTVKYEKAANGGWISMEAAALTVPQNPAPVLAPIGDQVVTEGGQLLVAVSATDDGPAPLALSESNTLPGEPSIMTDFGGGAGQLAWTPGLGAHLGSPYLVAVTATDGADAFDSELIQVTVLPPPGGGSGALSMDAATAPSTVNLTQLGNIDWAHWGRTGDTSFDRKAGVSQKISDVALIPGSIPSASSGMATSHAWGDGTPQLVNSGTSTGLRIFASGKGFEITVPAGTQEQTLYFYGGGNSGATGIVTASLSDASAPPASLNLSFPAKSTRVMTITFRSTDPGAVLNVRYEKTNGTTWISLESAALTGQFALPYAENFNNGNAPGWKVFDEGGNASSWGAATNVLRQANFIGFNGTAQVGAYHQGTFAYLDGAFSLTDYRFSITATPGVHPGYDIGVIARLAPSLDRYLRMSFSTSHGTGRLESRGQAGFATLAHDARGLAIGTPVTLALTVKGGVIIAEVGPDKRFAAYDTSLANGSVAVYCRDQCTFDDAILTEVPVAPVVAITRPQARSIRTSGSFAAEAVALNVPSGGSVVFTVAGVGGACGPATQPDPGRFVANCTVPAGVHELTATLRDQSATPVDSDVNTNIGIGDNYAAVGDSITNGLDDSTATDGVSAGGWVVAAQGYPAILTTLLNASETPSIVHNNGVPGDTSTQLVNSRIAGALERHADANRVIILIGVNDAGGASFTPSGMGCSGEFCNGTYKGNVQTVINAALGAGKTPLVLRAPPRFGDPFQTPYASPETHPRNLLIRDEYNVVVATELGGHQVGPDLFDYFLGAENRFYLYATNLHPNALGYEVIAHLVRNSITGASGAPNVSTSVCLRLTQGGACQSPHVIKQNLMETGDRLYTDANFVVTSIPAGLTEGRWFMTQNADRTQSNSDYLFFSLPGSSTVYVAWPDGASPPAWLGPYTDSGMNLPTSNGAAPTMSLYRRTGVTGTVVAGGADSATTGAPANFVVITVTN